MRLFHKISTLMQKRKDKQWTGTVQKKANCALSIESMELSWIVTGCIRKIFRQGAHLYLHGNYGNNLQTRLHQPNNCAKIIVPNIFWKKYIDVFAIFTLFFETKVKIFSFYIFIFLCQAKENLLIYRPEFLHFTNQNSVLFK